MAPDVVCTERSFDVLHLFWEARPHTGTVVSTIKLLSLLGYILWMLLMSWLIDECFSDSIMLGGTCSRAAKLFLFIVQMKRHRQGGLCRGVKGDFSFLFEQADISLLHLIFIRCSDSLQAVFPFL